METKNVSVIVPVYNKEKELVRCVKSLLDQSIDKLEIILIDDGSTDGSPELCDELERKYCNIIVQHIKNNGLGNARNEGIKLSSGKYIAFVDSDDYIDNHNYFRILFEKSEKLELDICLASRMSKVSKNARQSARFTSDDFINDLITDPLEIDRLRPKLIGISGADSSFLSNSSCAGLYKKGIIISNHIFFKNEKEYLSEDLIFNIDFLKYVHRFYVEDIEGYCYWYNPESLSRRYNKNRFESLAYMIEYLEREFALSDFDSVQRISLYFWRTFEKCINQEIRYFKHRSIKNIMKELFILCENDVVNRYTEILIKNKLLNGLHGYLCRCVKKRKYVRIILMLKLYNALKEGNR